MSMIKIRQMIEREIAEKAIDSLLAAGYCVTVYSDRSDTEPDLKHHTDKATILQAMFTTDEDLLCVDYPSDSLHKGHKHRGYVLFVYGNSGWDVLSDYTTNLEEHLKEANAFADKLSS